MADSTENDGDTALHSLVSNEERRRDEEGDRDSGGEGKRWRVGGRKGLGRRREEGFGKEEGEKGMTVVETRREGAGGERVRG
jgi:hypothetical protein